MSGKNNVNPDHYKIAGRDRPNEVLAAAPHRHGEGADAAPAKGRAARNFIPGALPVGEAPAPPRRRARAKRSTRASRPSSATRTRAKATKKKRTSGASATRKRGAAPRGRRRAS
jgi:hypothetical protein